MANNTRLEAEPERLILLFSDEHEENYQNFVVIASTATGETRGAYKLTGLSKHGVATFIGRLNQLSTILVYHLAGMKEES